MTKGQQVTIAVVASLVAIAGVIAVVISLDDAPTTVATTAETTSGPTSAVSRLPESTLPESTLPESTLPAPSTSTSSAAPVDANLAKSPIGTVFSGGTFVYLTDADLDQECQPSLLAFDVDDTVTHVYDDLGSVAGLTQYDGPYGSIALVENCEEAITRILFAETAMLAENDVPPISGFAIDFPEIFHLDEFAWLGFSGWFSADATFYDGDTGWNDVVVFDPFDGSVEVWADRFGDRNRRSVDGVDFVVPTLWSLAPGNQSPRVRMTADESDSWIEISVLDGFAAAGTITPADGETVLPVRAFDAELWEEVDLERSRVAGSAGARDYVFIGEDGARTVRVVELADRTVVIEGFQSNGTGQAYVNEVVFAIDLVRVFDAVG